MAPRWGRRGATSSVPSADQTPSRTIGKLTSEHSTPVRALKGFESSSLKCSTASALAGCSAWSMRRSAKMLWYRTAVSGAALSLTNRTLSVSTLFDAESRRLTSAAVNSFDTRAAFGPFAAFAAFAALGLAPRGERSFEREGKEALAAAADPPASMLGTTSALPAHSYAGSTHVEQGQRLRVPRNWRAEFGVRLRVPRDGWSPAQCDLEGLEVSH